MKTVIIDTETTDMWKFKLPMDHPSQPRVCQIAALFYDGERPVGAANFLIRVECDINPEAAAVHGWDRDCCHRHGLRIDTALGVIASVANGADELVAHNVDFDSRVLMREYAIIGKDYPFRDKPHLCTMKRATDLCRIPGSRGYKWPKLAEAYDILLGRKISRAHDALADVQACAEIHFHLRSLGV